MTPRVLVRPAAEDDLEAIADMLEDFVRGHPAHDHTRSIPRLREAYFGSSPVARLLVATHDGGVVGMAQWTRVYDMFWAMYGAASNGCTCAPRFADSASRPQSPPRRAGKFEMP